MENINNIIDLMTPKQEAIEIAEQLVYKKDVIDKIANATSINQISRILKQARIDLD